MISKFSHKVVYCTSEDSSNSARELNNSSPDSRGWISARFPDYPLEIGFEILNGGVEAHLTQIQILSHHNKIATKIEIFVGVGDSYETASYKRLGYLSLDSNERSSYQARELKTVFVDHFGNFIKFKMQKNFVNPHNPYNQVGIISVSFSGEVILQPSMSVSLPSSSTQHHYSPPPAQVNPPIAKAPVSKPPFGIEVNLDAGTLSHLQMLAEAKTKAVECEDYATAKAIKLIEQELKEMTVNLAKLDESKKNAVADEDFDLAKELKDQGDELRAAIKQKV
jgi:centrosomal protein CEP104